MNKYHIGLLAAGVLAGAGIAFSTMQIARANQPHMQAALHALQNAEHQLSVADEDKGGHRARALDHVHAAIAEVQEGMSYDRRH